MRICKVRRNGPFQSASPLLNSIVPPRILKVRIASGPRNCSQSHRINPHNLDPHHIPENSQSTAPRIRIILSKNIQVTHSTDPCQAPDSIPHRRPEICKGHRNGPFQSTSFPRIRISFSENIQASHSLDPHCSPEPHQFPINIPCHSLIAPPLRGSDGSARTSLRRMPPGYKSPTHPQKTGAVPKQNPSNISLSGSAALRRESFPRVNRATPHHFM